ncbi:MAG: Rieske 2Fe-2S domain-containing protein [Gemmatimonas sp.]
MVPKELNEMMTGVGPGTPGGELLRRYWQPVAAAVEVTKEAPITKVRVLGEDLVLYRMTTGQYGLINERCPHRLASLVNGRVDAEGIRCPYHGWKFDPAGRCLETPNEPPNSRLKDAVKKQRAYPVEKLGGMLFAYMGPQPVPALPRWDVLTWDFGKRWIEKHDVLQCNWLQAQENSVDPSHLYWLHGSFGTAHLVSTVDGFHEEHEFLPFEYGIMKKRITPGKKPGEGPKIDQHPLLFPNVLRHVSRRGSSYEHNLQYRIPIDDTHTQVWAVRFEPCDDVRMSADADAPVEPYPFRDAAGKYLLNKVLVQDSMCWESQGEIVDRSQETLGAADRGIVMLRRMVREQIDIVQKGGQPLGVVPQDRAPDIIELDVINERIGLVTPQRRPAA